MIYQITITDIFRNLQKIITFLENSGELLGVNSRKSKLCPNCARQGQIFPNISKRNQKLVEKVE